MAKHLIEELRERDLLEYGTVISANLVRHLIGIEVPTYATFKEWEALRLAEMSAVAAVRDKLLHEGKYLKAEREHYRILNPSENHAQVKRYEQEAKRKTQRGQLLLNNTPLLADLEPHDNTAARLMMKTDSVSRPRAA